MSEKQISEKQLAANRANAQKSTGPRTAEGKQRSRLNACRHGLSGQVDVLPQEDMEAYHQFVSEMVESFKPADARERQLAQAYASCQWRINRAASMENCMLTLGIVEEIAGNLQVESPEVHSTLSNAKTFRAQSRDFDRFSMYSHRLARQSKEILQQLKEFQAERQKRFRLDLVEAEAVYKYHQMQNLPFDPPQNGFDLTIGDIEEYVYRKNVRTQAREAGKVGFDREKYLKMHEKVAA